MKKTGILTFHYSNNYGGVLQSYALYDYLRTRNVDAEIINYVPSRHKYDKSFLGTGLERGAVPKDVLRRIKIRSKFGRIIGEKFDGFRNANLRMSTEVNEGGISGILGGYDTIIVGSDQVWNPSQQRSSIYFLGFGQSFRGNKISYAADSTVSDTDPKYAGKLRHELSDFTAISVRNEHSQKFVETLVGKTVPIVADPTVLCDFGRPNLGNKPHRGEEGYIFVYVLGKDIKGTNDRAVKRIRQVYGRLKVYAVVDPTREFNLGICDYADEVLYDVGPEQWLDMLHNAAFVYTDSFHGTLLSLKYHRPFLAYYAERARGTRFADLGNRYKIRKFIVESVDEIETKGSLEEPPDFGMIDDVVEDHRRTSVQFLHDALRI